MTKEEAKIIIGNIPIKPEVLDDSYDITEYQEAKAMAIKALELVNDFEKAQIITGGRLNGRTYAYKCGLSDGQRQTRWIPVSEALPEHGYVVLAYCLERNNIFTGYIENEKWFFFGGTYAQRITEAVTAWMPVPESYKEENADAKQLEK